MVLSKSRRSTSKKMYKKSSKYPKVVKPKTGRATPNLRKYVLKQVYKHTENKMRQSGGIANLGGSTYTGFQTNSIIPLTPFYEAGLTTAQNLAIGQGTGVADRVGNSISTKSGYLRAVLYPAPYNVNLNPQPRPIIVTQWIFKLKSGVDDSTASVMNVLLNNWFKDQNGSVGLLNSLSDSVLKSNPDYINVLYRKSYKLGYAAFEGTGSLVGNQYFQNNDYKHNHIIKMNVTDYLRKRIRYSDNNLMPLTASTYMAFTVAYADGSALPATVVPAYLNWEYDFQYEDA